MNNTQPMKHHMLVTLQRTPAHFAWPCILSLCILFFTPYFLPGNDLSSLGAYSALEIIPVIVAALLRARRGALVVMVIGIFGFTIVNITSYGTHWSGEVFRSWLVGNLGGAIFAIALGLMTSLSYTLAVTHQQLVTTHEELLDAHATIREQALIDALTTLPNHRALLDYLAGVDGARQPYAVLFFDLDHFKTLNDIYEHQGGDYALREFAAIARDIVTAPGLVGRWGGEEFVAILPEMTTETAYSVAERIRIAVTNHRFALGGGIHITCSIGVASFPADGESSTALLKVADRAMYAAKRLGRNQTRRADDVMVTTMSTEAKFGTREEAALFGTVEALSALIEARDGYTGKHTDAVGELVMDVALALDLDIWEARMLAIAARLHDLGKIAIPDEILYKPTRLTEEEWQLMRAHPVIGADIVSRIPALRGLANIIRAHHERWDGAGYPDKLAGEDIPLGARVIAVVDSYNAMTTTRPYRQARDKDWALAELRRCASSQFDPVIVATLEQMLNEDEASAAA